LPVAVTHVPPSVYGSGTDVAEVAGKARLLPQMLLIDPGATGAKPLAAETVTGRFTGAMAAA